MNLSEEWYRNALELEADGEVSAGPPGFCFCDRGKETKAGQKVAATVNAKQSLQETSELKESL